MGHTETTVVVEHAQTRGHVGPKDLGSGAAEWSSGIFERSTVRSATAQRAGPYTPDTLGRFHVERRLGAGAMGEVYEAHDPVRREMVAIKVLSVVDAGSVYRFKQEFRALAGVLHQNLVRLHELFFEDGRLFFTMEVVHGEEFLGYVRPPGLGAPDYDRLWSALRGLVAGVNALHQAGRLHRDIKPSNVLVDSAGRVVLLDFGLVQEIHDARMQHTSGTGRVLGTPAYMSPEQAGGEAMGPASDWFSVGVVLCKALTGELPFAGMSVFELLAAREAGESLTPKVWPEHVPPELGALCRRMLESDAARRPGGDELAGLVGASEVSVPRGPDAGASTLFVGRDAELLQLREGLAASQKGSPACVLLGGSSGVGKTALLDQFRRELGLRPDVVVLAGRCYERESVPYKAVDAIVDALARYLQRLDRTIVELLVPRHIHAAADLFPVLLDVDAISEAPVTKLGGADDDERRWLGFTALKQLLSRVADRRALVVLIDDVQWSDMDSVALLEELVRAPDAPAMMLTLSYRQDAVEAAAPLLRLCEAMQSFGGRLHLAEVDVGPLAHPEAQELARRILESGTPARAEAVARESRGVPYFIVELARFFGKQSETTSSLDGLASVRVSELLRARVEQLPPSARRLLSVIAVAGRRIEQGVALRAAFDDEPDRDALDLLRTGSFVRSGGVGDEDWVETYHDRIREWLAENAGVEEMARIHRRLAVCLEKTGRAAAEELALHFHHAGSGLEAAEHAAAGAESAATALAFERAAQLYRLALSLTSQCSVTPARLHALRVALADALSHAGNSVEAARAYERAIENAPESEKVALLRRAARQYLVGARPAEGRRVLERLLAGVGLVMPPPGWRARVSLLLGRFRLSVRGLGYEPRAENACDPRELERTDACWAAGFLTSSDVVAGADFYTRHLNLALRLGEPARIARGLGVEAILSVLCGRGSWDQCARLLERARGIASEAGSDQALGWIAFFSGLAAVRSGRFHDAVDECDAAAVLLHASDDGAGAEARMSRFLQLTVLEDLGRWARLAPELRRFGKLAERDDALRWHVRRMQALLLLARDQPDQALDLLEERRDDPPALAASRAEVALALAVAQVHLYRGEPVKAWTHLLNRRRFLRRQLGVRDFSLRARYYTVLANSALACAYGGHEPRRARRTVRSCLSQLRRQDFSAASGWADLAWASLAALEGDSDRTTSSLRRAIDEFERHDMALYAAMAGYRLGQTLGGRAGGHMMRAAEVHMRRQGIERPTRLLRVFAPGFSPVCASRVGKCPQEANGKKASYTDDGWMSTRVTP